MPHLLLPLLATLALAQGAPARPGDTPFAQHAPLAVAVRSAPDGVPKYGKVELTLDLAADYANPFDPDQIDVHADFTAPSGRTVVMPGFLDQPFTRALVGGEERITSNGPPVWRVCFAPDEAGTWRYVVHARDHTGEKVTPARTVRVTAGAARGFVRRSAKAPTMFAFDDGRPFFAVGENMGWPSARGTFDYDDWLGALGKSGGNWVRVWMWAWNCALEWSPDPKAGRGTHYGLGVYSLDNAWKLDYILDAADRDGVYVMVCFGTYGELATGGYFGEGQWPVNPYNAKNGGPCATPEDFWTNPTARKLYERRLRYIMARYGWRTHVQAWEFWNEANAPARWVREMAQYLKGTGADAGHPADPYRHLLTTTYSNDAVWSIPEIDFTQTHSYGTGNIPDHAPIVHDDARLAGQYGKPHLMAEFGIDWRASDAKYDPEGKGVNLHNGLWAAAASGDAGGAMLWWWDNYVAPKNLYAPFDALRRFSDAVPWTAAPWKTLRADPATTDATGPETWSNLTLAGSGAWGRSPVSDFTITPAGVQDHLALPTFLYSPAKPDLRTTPAFHVHFARPGQFAVRVDTVSDHAHLRFLLDGKPVRDVLLSAKPPADPNAKPEYESTTLRKEYGVYQARFNKEYGVAVPEGDHTITLENADGDWASIETYTLAGYRSSRFPPLDLYGITNGQAVVLWAHNAPYNWKSVHDGKTVPAIRGARTTLRGLAPGRWRVEWWNTWRGTAIRSQTLRATTDGLRLALPDIPTDVAALITPVP